jgi:probable F420-dependent oxidoreductase
MRISVRCFGFPLDWYVPIARAAEEAGFAALWVPDHVVSPTDTGGAYPYSATGRPSFTEDTPFADPLVMVAHLAAVTTRIEFGVGVYVLPLRHPLPAARAVMSASVLSGGRLVLGVGVGWMRQEFDAVDQPFDGRGGRTEEALAIMRAVWSGRPVAHDGRWYTFPELTVAPPVGVPVPVLIGGASRVAIARAARVGDGWYGPPGTGTETAALVTAVEARLAEQGRPRTGFRVVVRAPETDPVDGVLDLAGRDVGVDEIVVNLPRGSASVDAVTAWIAAAAARLKAAGLL